MQITPHQHLEGGRAAAAAFYPQGLIKAILRGIRDTADAEEADEQPEESHPQVIAATLQCQHAASASAHQIVSSNIQANDLEEKLADAVIPFRYANGTTVNLKPRWRER